MQSISQTNRRGHGAIPYCYVENNKYIHSRNLWADIFFLFTGIFLNSFSHPELRVLYYSTLHHLPGPVFTCEKQLVVKQEKKTTTKKQLALYCVHQDFSVINIMWALFLVVLVAFILKFYQADSGLMVLTVIIGAHWLTTVHPGRA